MEPVNRIEETYRQLTASGKKIIKLFFSLFAESGDNILTPNPSYPLFDPIAKMAGIELRHYQLGEKSGWAVDLNDLKQKTDPQTKAVILISPHNPTGSVFSKKQIEEIVDWANKKEIPLICLENYRKEVAQRRQIAINLLKKSPHIEFVESKGIHFVISFLTEKKYLQNLVEFL